MISTFKLGRSTNANLIAAALALGARTTYDGTTSKAANDMPFGGEANGIEFMGRTLGVDPRGKPDVLHFNGWAGGSRFHGEVTSDLRYTCYVCELEFSGMVTEPKFIGWKDCVMFSAQIDGEVFSGELDNMKLDSLGVNVVPRAALSASVQRAENMLAAA